MAKCVDRQSSELYTPLTLVGRPAGLSGIHAIDELRRFLSQYGSSDQEATTAIGRLLDLAGASLPPERQE